MEIFEPMKRKLSLQIIMPNFESINSKAHSEPLQTFDLNLSELLI
ncbi:hypothetical protein T4C_3764 [Trichinella pseudospiralis]|uniref:Uncharacterized protein n=1 Tax=Trichinella pseudospiralis TaxID=6337 RepID=A0A0V1HCL1_TRIPS|nr:hypothetical protein T4C_3764 [Trichinella pseudospiralis]